MFGGSYLETYTLKKTVAAGGSVVSVLGLSLVSQTSHFHSNCVILPQLSLWLTVSHCWQAFSTLSQIRFVWLSASLY